jgi:hypothetical protein
MNAAGAASQAALRNRRSAIELGLSPIAPAKRVAAIKQMLPKPKASGAIEAALPTATKLPNNQTVIPASPVKHEPKVLFEGLTDNRGILDASTVARESIGGLSSMSLIPQTLKPDSLNQSPVRVY